MSSKYATLNDKEWLYEEYWKKNKSSLEIAKVVGCGACTVLNAMERLDIPKRSYREAWKLEKKKYPRLEDREWLYNEYWKRGLSISEIARDISDSCSLATVFNAMKRLGIPRRSNSKANSGERNHFFGKTHTKDAKEKMQTAHMGKPHTESHRKNQSEAIKKCWEDEEFIKKILAARNAKPNKLESKLKNLLSHLIPNKFAYNGDFTQGISIGRRIPDFVDINGHKRIIELFGEPFHSPLCVLNWQIPTQRYYNETIKHYKRYGYKCIIFWSADIRRADAESFIKSKLEREGWIDKQ